MEPDIFQKCRPLWYDIMKKNYFNSWIKLVMHGVIIVTYTSMFSQISDVQSRRRSCTGAISSSWNMPDRARNFYCAISALELHECNLGRPKRNMCYIEQAISTVQSQRRSCMRAILGSRSFTGAISWMPDVVLRHCHLFTDDKTKARGLL